MFDVVELSAGCDRLSIGRAVAQLFSGEANAVWIRGFADEKTCNRIVERFFGSEQSAPRKDNVPGIMVGESHYFKSPASYYQKCDEQRAAVDSLFEQDNPVLSLYDVVGSYSRCHMRAAAWEQHEALHTRAIVWQERADSDLLLKPHDDVSQVFCDRNDGWEIMDINTLVAVNFYARCQAGGGMLRIYDLKHTEELAEEIGVAGVGYPYPPQILDSVSYVDVPVETGDFLLLNGAYVHGVTKSQGERLVLNSFMGDLKQDEIIYWT